jgi:hypothetical protein
MLPAMFAKQLERHRAVSFALISGLLLIALSPATAISRSTDDLAQSRNSEKTRTSSVSEFARFRLQGSNGYRIQVRGSSGGVELVAARRHEAATYLDREGVVDHDSIRGRFGDFGRIDLYFHPTKKVLSNEKLKGDALLL